MVAPVLDARAGPRAGGAAVNRRPEHLTAREEEILRAIRHSSRTAAKALSVRQLGREIGLRSPASVAYHLASRGW
ncbi:hypothetical protein ACFU6S_21475 [Streptomyces sp. NPDC057456]|uniref:LexA family protein n=1 Tax=Streptomyces sp. NPDC057456 TaxID=3346139 RepID=UPI003674C7CF